MVGCLRIHSSVRAAGLVVIVLKDDRRKGLPVVFWRRAKLVDKPNYLQAENWGYGCRNFLVGSKMEVAWKGKECLVSSDELLGNGLWLIATQTLHRQIFNPKDGTMEAGAEQVQLNSRKVVKGKIGSPFSHQSMTPCRCQPKLLALFWSKPELGFLIMLLTKAVSILSLCSKPQTFRSLKAISEGRWLPAFGQRSQLSAM